MKTFSSPLTIQGFGLATGIGDTSATTLKSMNAEKSALRGHKQFYDASYNPLVCAFRNTETLVGFKDRATALAQLAIAECLAHHQRGQIIDLYILMPDPNDAHLLEQCEINQVVTEITARVQQHLGNDMISVRSYLDGQAGLGLALIEASNSGTHHSLIVSSDSFCDRERLNRALMMGRLMSQKNPWGFIPGEASGAILVAKAGDGPTIRNVGVSREKVTEDNETEESDFLAMSLAVREACTNLGDQKITHWVSDANGSRYRASEVAHAILRATPFWLEPDLNPTFPSGDIGDCGATAGMVGIQLGLGAKRQQTLISLGSQNDLRCAIRVSA